MIGIDVMNLVWLYVDQLLVQEQYEDSSVVDVEDYDENVVCC